MSMGLTMPTAYPGPRPAMRGYGRAVDAAILVGLLADPIRLKVVAALALGAGTLEEVAAASGLPLKDVALAARRLSHAGLVARDRNALQLHAEVFGIAAPDAAQDAPAPGPPAGPPRRRSRSRTTRPRTPSCRRSSAGAGWWRSRRRRASAGSSSST